MRTRMLTIPWLLLLLAVVGLQVSGMMMMMFVSVVAVVLCALGLLTHPTEGVKTNRGSGGNGYASGHTSYPGHLPASISDEHKLGLVSDVYIVSAFSFNYFSRASILFLDGIRRIGSV